MTFEEALANLEAARKQHEEMRDEAMRTGDPNTWGAATLLSDIAHKWNGITAYLYRRDDPDGVYGVKKAEVTT